VENETAVVLFSGGMDSTVALFWARERFKDVHCLSYEYGQRHWVELEAARRIARMAGATHRVASIGAQGVGVQSLLTRGTGKIASGSDSVVPGRNALFLWAGAVHAKAIGSAHVVIAVTAEDQADYIDCRIGAIQSMEAAMEANLGMKFHFHAPFIGMTKPEVLLEAKRLGCWAPVVASWSCYSPVAAGKANEKLPCEQCPACVKRAAAFAAVEAP
jgi:7-cyano-7-deazaguanine synthase